MKSRFTLRVMLPTVAAIGLLLTRVSAAQDIEQLLQQAAEASQRSEYEFSIPLLTRAMKQPDAPPLCWYLRGRDNFRFGRVDDSVADFDKYVDLQPMAENRLWER